MDLTTILVQGSEQEVFELYADESKEQTIGFSYTETDGRMMEAARDLLAVVKRYAEEVNHDADNGPVRACCFAEWDQVRAHMGKENPHKTDCAAVAAIRKAEGKED